VWIYTVSGFYSIVEDRDDPDLLLVGPELKAISNAFGPRRKSRLRQIMTMHIAACCLAVS